MHGLAVKIDYQFYKQYLQWHFLTILLCHKLIGCARVKTFYRELFGEAVFLLQKDL